MHFSVNLPNSRNGYGLLARVTTELSKHAVNSQRKSSKKQKAVAAGRLHAHTVMYDTPSDERKLQHRETA